MIRAGQDIFYANPGLGPVPPCASCHSSERQSGMPMMGGMHMGMMGRGMMGRGSMGGGAAAALPYLDGQHADYLVAQLNQFASGERSWPASRKAVEGLGWRPKTSGLWA